MKKHDIVKHAFYRIAGTWIIATVKVTVVATSVGVYVEISLITFASESWETVTLLDVILTGLLYNVTIFPVIKQTSANVPDTI